MYILYFVLNVVSELGDCYLYVGEKYHYEKAVGSKSSYIVICTLIRSLIYSYNLEDLLILKTWAWVKWDMVKTGAGQ